MIEKILGLELETARSVGQRLTHCAAGASSFPDFHDFLGWQAFENRFYSKKEKIC